MGAVLLLCALGNLYASAGRFFDADALLLPSLYRDWANGQLHWFFWSLPPSRCLFPDIPVFFSLNALLGNAVSAMLGHLAVHFVADWMLLGWLLKIYGDLPFKKSLLPSLFSLTLLSVPFLFPGETVRGLFWPTSHAEAVSWSLLSFCVLGCFLNHPSGWRSLWLVLASFLAGLCEPLCFLLFVVPSLFILLFSARIRGSRRWLAAGGVLFAAFTGSWVGDRLVPVSMLQYLHQSLAGASHIFESLRFFVSDLLRPEVIPSLVFLVAGFYFIFRAAQRGRLAWPWALLMAFIVLALCFSSILIGRYCGLSNWRYFSFGFLAPLLALTLAFWGRRVARYSAILALAVASLSYIPQWPSWADLNYPPLVRDVDALKSRFGLESGLADYWLGTPVNYFSRQGADILCLDRDGLGHLKLVNLAHFGLAFSPLPQKRYNYILTRGSDPVRLLGHYGKPREDHVVFLAGEPTHLWIYDRDLGEVILQDKLLWGILRGRLSQNSYFLEPGEMEAILRGLQKLMDGSETPAGRAIP